jgi:lipid-binding SYLF domain-containing protein
VHRGRGVVTCRSNDAWSTPSFVRVSGSGAGLLAGVESVDLVMLIMNEESARSLAGARLQFGAAGSIAAGPVGRQWQATTEPGLGASLFTYSSSRGLFAGLSLTEVVIETDDEAARAFYGDARDFSVLLRGTAARPPEVDPFLAAMRRAF